MHGDPSDWTSWTRHLKKRKNRPSLFEVVDSPRSSPFLWCLPSVSGSTVEQLESVRRARRGKETPSADAELAPQLEQWLADAPGREADADLALECLSWADSLPWLAQWLPAGPWMQLLETLQGISQQAEVGRMPSHLLSQWFAAELPYLLAYALPELPNCADLGTPAVDVMSRAIVALSDGEGLPHAENVAQFRPLAASWTRCALLAKHGAPRLDEEAQDQFDWAVTQALRMTRFDGRQMLTPEPTGDWDEAFFATLVTHFGDAEDVFAAREGLPKGKRIWDAPAVGRDVIRSASVNSEWSELAILRSDWKKASPQWASAYDGRRFHSEFAVARSEVWSGAWEANVEVDGHRLAQTSDWTETCWQEDEGVNYLELEAELEDGWRLQRQMLLARNDGFVFAADAILGDSEATAKIVYETRLPLKEDLRFQAGEETRDGLLSTDKPLAHAIPLALPEWRLERPPGELKNTVQGLQYTLEGSGPALYAPLFLDVQGSRLKDEHTWRRLTVASHLAIEPACRAVGYRIHIGNKQWLIYRSLTEAANRTVLGQNLHSTFFCAKFLKRGGVETILEIE